MTSYSCHNDVLDFRPCAVPGWRVAYLDARAPNLYNVWDLAGWLVQVETRYVEPSGIECEDRPFDQRPRYLAPAVMDSYGYMSDPTESVNFWGILGPTDPAPTREQADAELQVRQARAVRAEQRSADRQPVGGAS